MKIVVLNYTGDRANWGCQATSRNLLDFLRSSLAGVPHLDVVTIPLPRSHAVDDLVAAAHGARIRDIYAAEHPGIDDLRFLEALIRERFGDHLAPVETADVVVFQGEGSIGPQRYLRNVQLFGPPFLAAHLWRKPVLAMNQTLSACDADDARILARIMGGFALVAVREARAYAFARSIGLDGTLLCPDMAFAAARFVPPTHAPVPAVPYFCIAGAAVLESDDVGPVVGAIRQIALRHGLRPVFVFSRPADQGVVRAAAKLPGDLAFDVVSAADHQRVEQILPLLANATLLLGRRYHTAISALAQGTPVILLPGNTFKNEGLGPMLGLEIPVFSVQDVSAIVAEAERIVGAGERLRERIRDAVRRARAAHAEFGDVVRRFVTGATPPAIPDCLRPEPPLFPTPGPHDALYAAQNRAPRSPSALLGRWRLCRLRNAAGFRPASRPCRRTGDGPAASRRHAARVIRSTSARSSRRCRSSRSMSSASGRTPAPSFASRSRS